MTERDIVAHALPSVIPFPSPRSRRRAIVPVATLAIAAGALCPAPAGAASLPLPPARAVAFRYASLHTALATVTPRPLARLARADMTAVRTSPDEPVPVISSAMLRTIASFPLRVMAAASRAASSAKTRVAFRANAIKPFAGFSSAAVTLRDSIVELTRAQLGRRYVYGGETPSHGFDCSGLVRYVLTSLHLVVPRTALEQSEAGEPLARDTSDLRRGDLVLFSGRSSGEASHVGIYVGDGRFIHASSAVGAVVESSLDRPRSSLAKIWTSARRIVDDSLRAAHDSSR